MTNRRGAFLRRFSCSLCRNRDKGERFDRFDTAPLRPGRRRIACARRRRANPAGRSRSGRSRHRPRRDPPPPPWSRAQRRRRAVSPPRHEVAGGSGQSPRGGTDAPVAHDARAAHVRARRQAKRGHTREGTRRADRSRRAARASRRGACPANSPACTTARGRRRAARATSGRSPASRSPGSTPRSTRAASRSRTV